MVPYSCRDEPVSLCSLSCPPARQLGLCVSCTISTLILIPKKPVNVLKVRDLKFDFIQAAFI